MTKQQELTKLENYLKICKPHERILLNAKRNQLITEINNSARSDGFVNQASKDFADMFADMINKGNTDKWRFWTEKD